MMIMHSSPALACIVSAILASSPVAYALDRWIPGAKGRASAAFAGATLLSLCLAAAFFGGVEGTYFVIADAPVLGSLSLFADGLSFALLLALLATSGITAVAGFGSLVADRRRGFYSLYLLYVAGMVGLFVSANLILTFAFLELTLIASWLMLGWWGGENRSRASIRYFIYTELGAAFLLAGILLLWGAIGTVDALGAPPLATNLRGAALAAAFIMAGVFVKGAIFPVHGWLPDAYSESPPRLAAVLSFSTISVGAYLLLRIFGTFLPWALQDPRVFWALVAFGMFNIAYGGMAAMRQGDLRRVLSYSSISQAGYVLLGVASATQIGFLGVLIWAIAHGFGKPALFLISGWLRGSLGTDSLDRLGGLAGRAPVTSSSLFLSFLSLAGVPPMLGFWGEFFILLGIASPLLSAGAGAAGVAVLVLAATLTVISAAYGLWASRRILYGEPGQAVQAARDAALFALPVFALALLLIALGMMPSFISGSFWIYRS